TNCTTAVETYMRSFMELEISNATNDQKCLELNDTFQFLKNQSCVTDVYLRLLFVQAGDRLANYSCNVTAITNAIYPALAPEECPAKIRACVFSYVDTLYVLDTLDISDSQAVCNELANYAKCLKSTGTCTNDTEINSKVLLDQERARISPNASCIIPSLKSSLTFEECSDAMMQCATITKYRSNSTTKCQKTQESAQCIVDLNCANDPMLRLWNVIFNNQTKNLTGCVLDNIFPLGESNLTACQLVTKSCTYSYIDAVITKTAVTDICSDLSSFVLCAATSSCYTADKIKQINEDEIKRTRIGACHQSCMLSMETFGQEMTLMILSNTTEQSKCGKVKDIFQLLKTFPCSDDIYLRTLFVQANTLLTLTNNTCDITNDVYPPLTPGSCLSKQRSCLFSYVDNVIWVERNVNQTDAVCQKLADFAQCLLNDSTCTNQTQVTSIVTNEQMMKNIQPTSACIIPSFKKSYTFEECYKAVLQCQTIPLGYENSPEFCSKVQETVRCVVGLNCANDALLRVSNVLYNTAVKNISSACALDNLYPLGKPGLTACQTSRRDCTNTYVDQVLTRETDTDKCKDLNSYITCLSKSSSCNTTSQ
ncbi:hypothetical protein BgiBS90_027579, partial [Biomphalaria glabrata]